MKKYIFFWFTIVTICITLFSACKEHVSDVMLNKKELTLLPGETETLTATVQPDNADNTKVTWRSSNPLVATCNQEGLVTALKGGETTITVTTKEGNKTASCTVTVDYRSQWVGDWDFVVKRRVWGEGGIWYDTLYYLGKISYENANNVLKINYIENVSLLMKVDEYGTLLGTSQNPHEYSSGLFKEKWKVHIISDYGGNGGGGTDTIDGIKKEGGKYE